MKRKGRVDEALSTQSRYCYPGTTILINNFDIKTQEELDIAERRITTLMLATLQLKNTPKINTLLTTKYYLNIHKEVFGPIYSFAGETRNENISKGNTPFCRPEYIYSYLTDTIASFKGKIPTISTKDDFTTWLADFYGELNIIHPFREGNGRIAREYLRECVECINNLLGFDYELNFSNITEQDSKQFMHASIVSALTANNQELKVFFDNRLQEKQEVNTNSIKKGR